jgi:hypothetical protein
LANGHDEFASLNHGNSIGLLSLSVFVPLGPGLLCFSLLEKKNLLRSLEADWLNKFFALAVKKLIDDGAELKIRFCRGFQ